jgi:hypothetical protein
MLVSPEGPSDPHPLSTEPGTVHDRRSYSILVFLSRLIATRRRHSESDPTATPQIKRQSINQGVEYFVYSLTRVELYKDSVGIRSDEQVLRFRQFPFHMDGQLGDKILISFDVTSPGVHRSAYRLASDRRLSPPVLGYQLASTPEVQLPGSAATARLERA